MRMGVDEAGGYRQTGGVQLLLCGAAPQVTDGGDMSVSDGHVGGITGLAGAVDDRAAANDEIFHNQIYLL